MAPRAEGGEDGDGVPSSSEESSSDVSPAQAARAAKDALNIKKGGGARRADSTDAIATFLTRRFGLTGGLAWLGLLTFGVVSEQLKTRREVREAVKGTKDVVKQVEVTSPTGLRYTDLRTGGGEQPRNGYLLAADIVATVEETGTVVVDTRKARRQLIFTFGRSQAWEAFLFPRANHHIHATSCFTNLRYIASRFTPA